MRHLLHLLNRFRADERGAFGVIFGILAIVLIATSGAAIDFTTLEQARTRAQDALDSAALGLHAKIGDTGVTEDTIEAEALLLLNERLNDTNITATIEDVEADDTTGVLRLHARISVPMMFVSLVGVSSIDADVVSEATQGSGANIEVALVLDITGSMAGTKIETLRTGAKNLIDKVVKTQQSPAYSKVAIVPFSAAVDVGTWFAEDTLTKTIEDVRGTARASSTITGAVWRETASTLTISAINKANPGRVTTSTSHGLSTGAIVYISGVAGGGFTALNNRWFRVVYDNATRFHLQTIGSVNVSTSSYSGSYTANSGTVTVWSSVRGVSSITKASPGVVTTTAAHGLTDGDAVYFTDLAGGSGFTGMNNNWYCVDVQTTTTFRLQDQTCTNINTSGYSGTYTASSGVLRKCLNPECEVIVTSANNGLMNDEYVSITGVGGMTQINDTGTSPNNYPQYMASDVTTNTFTLEGSNGLATSAYTTGGTAVCMGDGCASLYFQQNEWSWGCWCYTVVNYKWSMNTKCVTERRWANQYTDAAPSTSRIGPLYTSDPNSCSVNDHIIPLSSAKDDLKTEIDGLNDGGATAGHIGLAWGWYLLSPNFASLWAASSTPGDYDDEEVVKVVVFMTDGVFNTAYCKGALSQDYAGAGGTSIPCDATNGPPNDQTASLCAAMKGAPYNIEIFTILFQVTNTTIEDMLETCATDDDHYFDADSNEALLEAFDAIGGFVSDLRLAE
jgi:Flp pilus assembly protein TadG